MLQTVWLRTTSQAGFPVTAVEMELQNGRDKILGKSAVRFLHPVISNFIHKRLEEINSTGQVPSRTEKLTKRLEETWGGKRSDVRITRTATPRVTLPER